MLRRIAFLGILTALVALTTHVCAASAQEWSAITRAQAIQVTMAHYEPWQHRVESIARHMPPMPLFWDVDQHAWYAPSVEIAFEEEVIQGYPDGSLRPGSMLTQEDAVILITRAEAAKRGEYLTWVDGADVIGSASDYGVRVAEPIDPERTISLEEFLWMFPEVDYAPPSSSSSSPSAAAAVSGGSSSAVSRAVVPAALPRSMSSSARSSNASVAQEQQYEQPQESEQQAEQQQQFYTPDGIPELRYASNQPFAIAMPDLGILDLTITHPSDPYTDQGLVSVLDRGVGHLFSYPGGGGKVFVYGHSSNWEWDKSGFAKIFRQINRLNVGNLVYVTYEHTLYVYQVTDKGSVPAGDLTHFSDGGDGEELLLYTCWPPDSISERYVVRAVPVQVIPF